MDMLGTIIFGVIVLLTTTQDLVLARRPIVFWPTGFPLDVVQEINQNPEDLTKVSCLPRFDRV